MVFSQKFIGPILILDDLKGDSLHLAALVLSGLDDRPPPIEVGGAGYGFSELARYESFVVWRSRFPVPADRQSSYTWNGTDYALASDLSGDLNLAYVSCNGEEHGDLGRDDAERNVMWRRLGEHHKQTPFSLLLHGGDQVYADEVTDNHTLTVGWPLDVPEAPTPEELEDLHRHLREAFAARYLALFEQADFTWMLARVPSLMQWDDHDICDGWGSLPEKATDSAIGQTIFSAAKEAALIFQHGCTEANLSGRFDDPEANHLCWSVQSAGLRILAPDLRSQRRFTQVMGDSGWAFMEKGVKNTKPGQTLLMSSVPLLGPRLSIIEWLMRHIPGVQKYEDDLRDQWQSRAHRDAWRRMLTLMREMAAVDGVDVTALSGEIHLAGRAEMDLGHSKKLHQLVASGITHRPPPKAWALALGTLAALGEDPLPEAPISIHPLPGQRNRYTAERNALILTRAKGDWSAAWTLEETGVTQALPISISITN